MNQKRPLRGFTLIEVLLYSTLLGVILAILTGILTFGIKVQVTQTASNELANQLTFSTQTIERLIRNSSSVTLKNNTCDQLSFPLDQDDPPTGASGGTYRCLILHMENETDPLNPLPRTPTQIWAGKKDPNCTTEPCAGEIKIKEGAASHTTFTSSSVSCNYTTDPASTCLTFGKFEDYPGHKIVRINLALTANTFPPATRSLVTAASRASAATFDSALLPTITSQWDLGNASYKWKNLFLSGQLIIGDTFSETNNYNGTDRGFKPVGYIYSNANPNTCSVICNAHQMTCLARVRFYPTFANLLCVDPYSNGENGLCGCE